MQFSQSILDTHGRKIFPLVGISRLRKWPKPCTFRLALTSADSGSNHNCLTCWPCMRVCVFLLQWPLQCYQKFTTIWDKYLGSSESLGYETLVAFGHGNSLNKIKFQKLIGEIFIYFFYDILNFQEIEKKNEFFPSVIT